MCIAFDPVILLLEISLSETFTQDKNIHYTIVRWPNIGHSRNVQWGGGWLNIDGKPSNGTWRQTHTNGEIPSKWGKNPEKYGEWVLFVSFC